MDYVYGAYVIFRIGQVTIHFHYMHKRSMNILINFSFCVPWNRSKSTGLKWHEGKLQIIEFSFLCELGLFLKHTDRIVTDPSTIWLGTCPKSSTLQFCFLPGLVLRWWHMLETFIWLLAEQLVLPFCCPIDNNTILCNKLHSPSSCCTPENLHCLSMHEALLFLAYTVRTCS